MGTIVGIDLGTTFSAVAQLDETGRPKIVHNKEGRNLTPSVVEFDSNNAIVGETARGAMYFENFQGAARFKRELGTQKTYDIGGKSYSPMEMSAFVLKKLKEDTESQIGPIDTAVVTIPANFSNAARDETMAAAQSVGLNVEAIINEPEAAALYYALDKGNLRGTFAVFDLGGGTFDFSVVKIDGFDVKVLGSNGVNRLGGDDFDEHLLDVIRKKYEAETNSSMDALPTKPNKNDAEQAKIQLSKRNSHQIKAGLERIEVTRSEFEESISGLLAQAKMACEGLMSELNLNFSDLSGVFLVGGSTRVPSVVNLVSKMTGKDPIATANVDEVVAQGAAFYAAHKSEAHNLSPLQRQKMQDVDVQLVAHKFWGTISLNSEINKEQNSIIIKKGEEIPCSRTQSFYTVAPGQLGVKIRITESALDDADPALATILKEGYLNLPGGRPAGQQIDVTLTIDESQILRGHWLDVESGQEQEITLNLTDAGVQNIDDPTKSFTVE